MSRIYWDTMLFVYWLEDHPVYAKRVRHFVLKMEERQDQLYTSAFTVGEVLVVPYKKRSSDTAKQIREAVKPSLFEAIPYRLGTADSTARALGDQGRDPA